MNNQFFTSESVTEGHPDKLCDRISDSVLDAIIAQDPNARVACETFCTTDNITIMGEISTSAIVDIEAIARKCARDIGYVSREIGLDADNCAVNVILDNQSADIALGVDKSLELKAGDGDDLDLHGAGDQGMMFGYACNETEELMPLAISLSHALMRRLMEVRHSGLISYLRPDGKGQVTVEYKNGEPSRVATVVVSTQHDPDISREMLCEDIKNLVINEVIPSNLMDENTKIYINPTGRFVIGGPNGDTGLTGRKIIVDTYGGFARHGGGAFSGKDPTKVDRSAAYAARYVAKNIVAAGAATRCEVQLAYAIGVARPVSVMVDTFGTGIVSDEKIAMAASKVFDLRPEAIIRKLNLRTPIYTPLSSLGHMGRTDLNVAWEKTDATDKIKEALGI